MKPTILLILSFLSYSALCQSLDVFDIDASAFPIIKAKFLNFDNLGKQITNLSVSGFNVEENTINRNILTITCPNPNQPKELSLVLAFDVSSSMAGDNLILAKAAAKSLITGLFSNSAQSECAIASFSKERYLNHDFTNDPISLFNAITKLRAFQGTNFDAAFIGGLTGCIDIIKRGSHKKVIIFLTDGQPDFNPQAQGIIQALDSNNTVCYAVALNVICPQSLRDIATKTGGKYFENVTSISNAEDVYRRILLMAMEIYQPCEISWESGQDCDTIRNVKISIPSQSVYAKTAYSAPSNSRKKIETGTDEINFREVPISEIKDTSITITASNGTVRINNVSFDDSRYTITDFGGSSPPFDLNANQSRTIRIVYSATDSIFTISKMIIESDACNAPVIYFGAGFREQLPAKSLRLTHPNGGEVFYAKSDMLIQWEGIMPSDTVSLEFSADSGATWQLITDKATGLNYIWTNIPDIQGNKYLIKITENLRKLIHNEPSIEWQKSYGGSNQEQLESLIETKDGFLLAGSSESNDGDISVQHGGGDYWIVKLDYNGVIEWQKCIGGSSWEYLWSADKTVDGGFIIAGGTRSNDGDVNVKCKGNGAGFLWINKLNEQGNILWQRCFDGEFSFGIIKQTIDGGYIVAPSTEDYCIIKLDSIGEIKWKNCFGGDTLDNIQSIEQTIDGGYILAGYTYSNNGNVRGNNGYADCWLLKLSSDGSFQWQKCLGGKGGDAAYSIKQTKDGGYVIAGVNGTNDGDVIGIHGYSELWVVKLNNNGDIEWQKYYGGSGYDMATSVQETKDGGYIIAGNTNSIDGDVSSNHGNTDYWIIKIDDLGIIRWEISLGGSKSETGALAIESNKGGYIIAGYSYSNDGDVSGNHGYADYWVVKLSPDYIIPSDTSDSLWSIIKPQVQSFPIDFGKSVIGSSRDSVVKGFLINREKFAIRIDSIYISGRDSTEFNMISDFSPFVLQPDSLKSYEFRFLPSESGARQADLNIMTETGNLVQKVSGEGVSSPLLVLSDIIDFGIVETDKIKDSVNVAMIKNIGSAPVQIYESIISYPNDTDFTISSGQAPFTLNPGDTAKMNLRFSPKDISRTNGSIEFYYSGTGSPSRVLLYGEGAISGPTITTSSIILKNLTCDYSSSDSITISNTGGRTLLISKATFVGANPNDFMFEPPFSVDSILPGSNKSYKLKFVPAGTGIRLADLILYSNAQPDSIITINLKARKDTVSIDVSDTLLDLGYLCPDEQKDINLSITNTGSIDLTVFTTLPSDFSVDNPLTIIDTNQNKSIAIHFGGRSQDGFIDETINVRDTICNYSKFVKVKGIIQKPYIQADDLTITALVGSYKDEVLTLSNPTERELTIPTQPAISDSRFEILNQPFPLVIPSKGSKSLTVRYTPTDSNKATLALSFNGLPCNISKDVVITGKGTMLTAAFQVGSAQGYPGDKVIIPIYLNKLNNQIQSGLTGFTANLRFNGTILEPAAGTLAGQVINNERILPLTLGIDADSNNVISMIELKAMLGNDTVTTLMLDNVLPIGGTVQIETIPGTFTIRGICREGGARLINSSGSTQLMTIKPNPAEDKCEIECNLAETGRTSLAFYSSMGLNMMTIFDEKPKKGKKLISIDLCSIPSGTYYFMLVTPTQNEIQRILIIK